MVLVVIKRFHSSNANDSTRVDKVLRIYRDSINPTVSFVAGASINAGDLNDAIDRALYVGEENRVSPKLEGDLDLNGKFLSGILKVKADTNNQGEIRLFSNMMRMTMMKLLTLLP